VDDVWGRTRRADDGSGLSFGDDVVLSVAGVIHDPKESTEAADLEIGANVLLLVMQRLANE
jgi:acetylornithine deacetylase/succinyl-diaminopimelate desuccinylase-like protein